LNSVLYFVEGVRVLENEPADKRMNAMANSETHRGLDGCHKFFAHMFGLPFDEQAVGYSPRCA
jgi:hypothetical protein